MGSGFVVADGTKVRDRRKSRNPRYSWNQPNMAWLTDVTLGYPLRTPSFFSKDLLESRGEKIPLSEPKLSYSIWESSVELMSEWTITTAETGLS